MDFTKDLVRDILTFEAFRDAELMLMDIDPKRLEYAVKGVQKIVDAGKYPAVVKGTQDRKEALKDADGVLITILQGGVEVWRHDIEIPKKYNVDICVGAVSYTHLDVYKRQASLYGFVPFGRSVSARSI